MPPPRRILILHASFESPYVSVSGYGAYLTGLVKGENLQRNAEGQRELDGRILTPAYDFLLKKFSRHLQYRGAVEHWVDGQLCRSSVLELEDTGQQGIKQYFIQADPHYQDPDSTLSGDEIFSVGRADQIYLTVRGRSGETYFASAVAAAASLFFDQEKDAHADILQLNGRDLSLAAPLMAIHYNRERARRSLPKVAVLATTHDTNEWGRERSTQSFNGIGLSVLAKADNYNPHLLLNAWSDGSNTVSPAVADQMALGNRSEKVSELFAQLRDGDRFYGINNGISFQDFDPTSERVLGQFRVQKDLSDLENQKSAAKLALFNAGLIGSATQQLFLYVGRFSWEKGIDFLASFSRHMILNRGAQVVLMGSLSSEVPFAVHKIYKMSQDPRYLGRLKIYEDRSRDQSQTLPPTGVAKGMLLRFAADFTIVPSILEAGGLVPVEARSFGSGVIASRVQGLKDRCQTPFNQYERDSSADPIRYFDCILMGRGNAKQELTPVHQEILRRINQVLDQWDRLTGPEKMFFQSSWIRQAALSDWNASGGAVDQYQAIYTQLLKPLTEEQIKWRKEITEKYFGTI